MNRPTLLLLGALLAPLVIAQPIEDFDPNAAAVAEEELTVQEMLDRAHDLVDDTTKPTSDRWLEALNLVIQALAWEPDHPQIYIELARITVRFGRYSYHSMQAAEAHLKRALELDPGNGFAYVLLGWLEIHRDNYDLAEELLTTAEEMGADSPWLDYNWAVLLTRTNRMDEALDHYWALIDPPHSDGNAVELSVEKLIRYYLSVEDFDTVEPLFALWRDYEDDPEDVAAAYAQYLWAAKQDLDGALRHAREAFEGGATDESFSLFFAGLLALSATQIFEAGNTEKAWAQFAQAERIADLGTLMVSAASNEDQMNVVYAVLEYGIPVNARSQWFGSYALHERVAANDKANVDKLLSLGADTNLLNAAGMNALHVAVLTRADQVIEPLLSAGVDPAAAVVLSPGEKVPYLKPGESFTPLSMAEKAADPVSISIGHIIADYMGVPFPSWAPRNLATMSWEELRPGLYRLLEMPEDSTVLEETPGEILILEAPQNGHQAGHAGVYLHGEQPPTGEELQIIAEAMQSRNVQLLAIKTFAELPDAGRLGAELSDREAGFSVYISAGRNAVHFFNSQARAPIKSRDNFVNWGETLSGERARQIDYTQVDTVNLIHLAWERFRQTTLNAMKANNVELVAERRTEFLHAKRQTGRQTQEFLVFRRQEPLDYDELDALIADARERGIDVLFIAVTADITPAARMLKSNQARHLPMLRLYGKEELERALSKRRKEVYVIDWSAPSDRPGKNLAEADWATISALVLNHGLKIQRWAAEPARIKKIVDRPYDLIAWEIFNESWFPPIPRRVAFVWRRDELSASEFVALIDEFEKDAQLSIVASSGVAREIENHVDPTKLTSYFLVGFRRILEASAQAGQEYYIDWDTPLAKLDPAAAGRP